MPVLRRRRPLVGLVAVAALWLAACDGETAPDADAPDGPDDAAADDADDVEDAEDADLPPVVVIEPDEVGTGEDAPEAGTLDGLVADVVADLPVGWNAVVVADPSLGPFVVGLPADSTVWRVEEDLEGLEAATADTSWGRYWLPIAAEARDEAEGSSLRAILLPADVLDDPDEVVSVQVSVTGVQDLPVEDAQATAERFAASFEDQNLDVDEVGVGRAGSRDVAAVRFRTPDDEFDDGVARRIAQWFHPEVDGGLVWSLACDAPVTREDQVADPCEAVLASFRPPPR